MIGFTFYIPEEIATTPAEGHCFVNRWWTVHPEKGVAFYTSSKRPYGMEPGEEDEPSPQCNSDAQTSKVLTARLHPDCIAKFIPAVFVRPAITEMHKQRKVRREAVAVTSTNSNTGGT